MRIKLAEAVTKQETIEVGVRPALHARKCDACGTIFEMEKWTSGDQNLGVMTVTFNNPHGQNFLPIDVCSFRCAHEIVTGAWRKVPELKGYADADAQLVRAELKITSIVLTEALVRSKWQSIDRSESNKRMAEGHD